MVGFDFSTFSNGEKIQTQGRVWRLKYGESAKYLEIRMTVYLSDNADRGFQFERYVQRCLFDQELSLIEVQKRKLCEIFLEMK